MLGEVAWKVTQTPGPLRAFFERVRARRGPQIAATATARKLAVLFWHLLTREQDYAFARPAMTRNKIRQLELLAGAPPQKGRKGIAGGKSKKPSSRPSANSPAKPKPPIDAWSATGNPPARQKWVRARHRGAHLKGPQRAKPRGRLNEAPTPALRSVSHPHPTALSQRVATVQPLDFHPSVITRSTVIPIPANHLTVRRRNAAALTPR